jgi:conjugative transfer signal peptidase TraF
MDGSERLRKFIRFATFGLVAASILAAPIVVLCRRLTFNTTTSLPWGLYTLRPDHRAVRGDIVAFAIPPPIVSLIAARHYLPLSFHLLKRLVATPGDQVCLDGQHFIVNGQLVSNVARTDFAGRSLPNPYRYCGAVPRGCGFVATASPTSLDSRFFGPIELTHLTRAEPAWTASSP